MKHASAEKNCLQKVTKYQRPTVYDIHPKGTIWHAILEGDAEDYIQLQRLDIVLTSPQTGLPVEPHPIWARLGEWLECNYKQEWIKELLEN